MFDFLKLKNAHLTAHVSPYGAALARLWVRGERQSLVLGLERPEDYASAPAAIGVVVGPIAGRVSGAKARIGATEYRLEPNTPPDCLHSGSGGLQNRLWQCTQSSDTELALVCDLPDGACGLPGHRTVTVHYRLQETALEIEITALSDQDTLFNAASHAYWTLDETGDLSQHRLQVPRARMCETGADLIPTGRLLDTSGGDFDFTQAVSPVSGPPLDGCFALRDAVSEGLEPVLHLKSLASGVGLNVTSNQPGVVLYTGENLPRMAAPDRTSAICPFSAIAIEAQGWPDSTNQPGFPSILLKSGKFHRQITRFSVNLP